MTGAHRPTSAFAVRPPLVAGWPLLGSALDLARDPTAFLTRQYLRHGPVFRVRAGPVRLTVLAGPQANLFVTREGAAHLRSFEAWHANDVEGGARRSMISLDGPEHLRLRALQKRGFARSSLNGREGEACALACAELRRWTPGVPVSVPRAMKRLVTEQLGHFGAGFSPAPFHDDLVRFVQTMLMVTVTRRWPRAALLNPRYRRAKARVFAQMRAMIEQHRQQLPTPRPPDLVDDLLAAQSADPAFLPEDDLLFMAMGPFIAGLDTAANTLSFLLYALHQNPEVLAQVRAELDAAFEAGPLTPDRLKGLDALHRATLETLRRYPIAPALTRSVTAPFEFGGYTLRAGEQVLIGTTVAHFLPDLYPQPDRFDIERFSRERGEHRQPGAFAPFGVGAHTCLGAGLAEVLVMLNAAVILRHLDLTPDPAYQLRTQSRPTPSPDDRFSLTVREIRQPFA